MNFLFRPDQDRIHRQDSWKKSAYAFVPFQTHFGALCGFADDIVAGGKGFGMHPHENMEITTILLSGSQRHKDDTGSEGTLDVHSIQTMSAGTGISHSEFNASQTEPFHSFQIWVYPKKKDVPPRHEKFEYQPEDKLNKILLALSPDKRAGSALINQDAFFSVARLEAGKSLVYKMNKPENGVYIHCSEGALTIEKYGLQGGDALGVYETAEVTIFAEKDSEIIFVEVPMENGIEI